MQFNNLYQHVCIISLAICFPLSVAATVVPHSIVRSFVRPVVQHTDCIVDIPTYVG